MLTQSVRCFARSTLILVFSGILLGPGVKAADDMDETPITALIQNDHHWDAFRERIRLRTFSEFMTPAIRRTRISVPSPDGGEALPANFFNIISLDYSLNSKFRLGYWQRIVTPVATNDLMPHLSAVPRNPRFSLRTSQVLDIPHLETNFDLYVQPGLAPEAKRVGRKLEMGVRINSNYRGLQSNWEFGETVEVNYELIHDPILYARLYGWGGIWANYHLNSIFSTQSYLTVNFCHEADRPGISLQLDLPRPYIQNGIGVAVSKGVWMAFLLNNYLESPPTLKNTWSSIWIAIEIL